MLQPAMARPLYDFLYIKHKHKSLLLLLVFFRFFFRIYLLQLVANGNTELHNGYAFVRTHLNVSVYIHQGLMHGNLFDCIELLSKKMECAWANLRSELK